VAARLTFTPRSGLRKTESTLFGSKMQSSGDKGAWYMAAWCRDDGKCGELRMGCRFVGSVLASSRPMIPHSAVFLICESIPDRLAARQ
jgi:hypothetical protein